VVIRVPAGNNQALVLAGKPAVLGFRADHPIGSELVVEAAFHAVQELAAAALQAVIAFEVAAEVAAEIESGPVINGLRRGIDRRLGIGPRRQIRRQGGRRERKKRGCAK